LPESQYDSLFNNVVLEVGSIIVYWEELYPVIPLIATESAELQFFCVMHFWGWSGKLLQLSHWI